jgi:hypothetical protein
MSKEQYNTICTGLGLIIGLQLSLFLILVVGQ